MLKRAVPMQLIKTDLVLTDRDREVDSLFLGIAPGPGDPCQWHGDVRTCFAQLQRVAKIHGNGTYSIRRQCYRFHEEQGLRVSSQDLILAVL